MLWIYNGKYGLKQIFYGYTSTMFYTTRRSLINMNNVKYI